VALAGCGRIAHLIHLPLLRAAEDFDLVAVAEAQAGRRPDLAGVEVVADAAELVEPAFIARWRIEALFICLPPAAHGPLARGALEAGLHVYVEKPLAADLAEAGELLAAARRRPDRVAAVGFNYRFEPAFQTLGRWLGEGRVGEPRLVRTLFSTARRELPGWKRRHETGGGVLLDLASHHFDLLPHLLGRRVTGVTARVEAGQGAGAADEERALVALEMEGGLVARSSFLFATADQDRWEIHGDAGVLEVDRRRRLPRFTPSHHWGANLLRVRQSLGALVADLAALARLAEAGRGRRSPLASYRRAFAAFASAARDGASRDGAADTSVHPAPVPTPPLATFEDGWRSLALVAAARASAARGSAQRATAVAPAPLPEEGP